MATLPSPYETLMLPDSHGPWLSLWLGSPDSSHRPSLIQKLCTGHSAQEDGTAMGYRSAISWLAGGCGLKDTGGLGLKPIVLLVDGTACHQLPGNQSLWCEGAIKVAFRQWGLTNSFRYPQYYHVFSDPWHCSHQRNKCESRLPYLWGTLKASGSKKSLNVLQSINSLSFSLCLSI